MDNDTFHHMLLYHTPSAIRFTQDSPVQPNVWLQFLNEPRGQHELILSMRHNHGAAKVASHLRQMLSNYRKKLRKTGKGGISTMNDPLEKRKEPRVAYIAGQIAVKVYFDELMRVILPHTKWWHDVYDQLRELEHRDWDDAHEAWRNKIVAGAMTKDQELSKEAAEKIADREDKFSAAKHSDDDAESKDAELSERLSAKEQKRRRDWKHGNLWDHSVTAEWSLFPQPERDTEKNVWPFSRQDDLADALMILWDKYSEERQFDVAHHEQFKEEEAEIESEDRKKRLERRRRYLLSIPFNLVWMVRTAGIIAGIFYDCKLERPDGKEDGKEIPKSGELKLRLIAEFEAKNLRSGQGAAGQRDAGTDPGKAETDTEREKRLELEHNEAINIRKDLVHMFTHLYLEWDRSSESGEGKYPEKRSIWQITKNRHVELAVHDSVKTVKADAASQLFEISCSELTWAIIDSGIDANHPAFKDTSEEEERRCRRKLKIAGRLDRDGMKVSDLSSRVIKTVDFTRLRSLLDCGVDDFEIDESGDSQCDFDEDARADLIAKQIDGKSEDQFVEDMGKRRRKFFVTALKRAYRASGYDERSIGGLKALLADDKENKELQEELKNKVKERSRIIRVIKQITTDIYRGREIDWQMLEPVIVCEKAEPPANSHGTHVAGILGADWIEDRPKERHLPLAARSRRMRGVCPDIKIMDVRVFRAEEKTDEFELIAAMQYLRWLNTRAGTMKIPGVNISMSLIHHVRRHACGQTPICKECDEATANGMVVVAAAGNRGFEMDESGNITHDDHYKTVSITDPGNAETVITVGSTHRKRPHEYGVSYFSSRGPTGDGRAKPDIVAPGEKIEAPVLLDRSAQRDGTSMAAPHVSGVAALLMARHTELLGKPAKVKTILCKTATDLGRERYFQGHGMVDGLRAIQSI